MEESTRTVYNPINTLTDIGSYVAGKAYGLPGMLGAKALGALANTIISPFQKKNKVMPTLSTIPERHVRFNDDANSRVDGYAEDPNYKQDKRFKRVTWADEFVPTPEYRTLGKQMQKNVKTLYRSRK